MTFYELVMRMKELFPDGEVEFDELGQIVVYTGLRIAKGNLEKFEYPEEGEQ